MVDSLNDRQQLFIVEYLKDLNATRAYLAAGYSEGGAAVSANKLLKNPKIARVIAEKQGKRLQKLEITAERVLQELACLGFANMNDYMQVAPDGKSFDVNFAGLSRQQTAAIQEITVDATGGDGDGERRLVLRNKFKLADKRGALELLGKHLELFTEKLKISGDAELVEKLIAGRKRAASK